MLFSKRTYGYTRTSSTSSYLLHSPLRPDVIRQNLLHDLPMDADLVELLPLDVADVSLGPDDPLVPVARRRLAAERGEVHLARAELRKDLLAQAGRRACGQVIPRDRVAKLEIDEPVLRAQKDKVRESLVGFVGGGYHWCRRTVREGATARKDPQQSREDPERREGAKSPAKLTAITPDGWSKPYRSFRKGSAKRAAGTEPPVNCEGALCERHIAVRTNKAILTTSCTM